MLSYKQIGNKNSKCTLVFLHGSTMTKGGMLPFAENFTEHNCIVVDLTAHGESSGEEPKEIKTFAEDVEETILKLQQDEIIGKNVVVLGYSMGGAITCEIALRKKIDLSGIVILSSGGDLSNHTPLVDQLKSVPVEEFHAADIFDTLFGTDTPEEEKKAIIEVFDSTKVADEIGYADLMVSNAYNRLEECKNIDVPTLFVHGNDDQIVLPTAAIETWKVIPNSQLLMIPYKGHAAIIEDAETVKKKILSFVEKL